MTCAWCGEEVLDGEAHPAVSSIHHRECLIRIIVGSAAHQLGQCTCYGGDRQDPPGMTVREAAVMACEMWQKLRCAGDAAASGIT